MNRKTFIENKLIETPHLVETPQIEEKIRFKNYKDFEDMVKVAADDSSNPSLVEISNQYAETLSLLETSNIYFDLIGKDRIQKQISPLSTYFGNLLKEKIENTPY